MADSINKQKKRQQGANGRKQKRARYIAEGRRERNKKRKMLRTIKAQPNNEELRGRIHARFGNIC